MLMKLRGSGMCWIATTFWGDLKLKDFELGLLDYFRGDINVSMGYPLPTCLKSTQSVW